MYPSQPYLYGMNLKSLQSALLKALPFLIIVSSVAVFIAPLFVTQIAYDGPITFHWIDAFSQQLAVGVAWPHWLPNSFAGLGSPTFYFYPPFAYLVAGGFRLLFPTVSLLTIYFGSSYLATIGSIFTFYLLSREFTTEWSSRWLSSLIYGLAPYHVFVLIFRGGLSEHFAFIWPPLIVLALYRILLEPRTRPGFVALAAIATSCLILTHVPSFVVISITVILPFLIVHYRNKRLGWAITSLVISGLLAAPYLLPILSLSKFVQLSRLDLDPQMPYDALHSFAVIAGGNNFTESTQTLIGYFGILLAVIGLFFYWRKSDRKDKNIRGVLLMSGVILILQNATISRPLWLLLKMNQTVQFTHRLLIAGCLVVAVAFAVLCKKHAQAYLAPTILLWTLAGIAFAGVQIFGLRVHPYNQPWTPYEPPEYAPATASPNRAEVIRFATEHAHDPFISSSDHSLSTVELAGGNLYFEDSINALHPTLATLHHWYWPDWVAIRVGAGTLAQTSDSSGRAVVALPQGKYIMRYELQGSRFEFIGWWLVAAGVAALLLMKLYLGRTVARHPPT
jgi:hypothetical protein